MLWEADHDIQVEKGGRGGGGGRGRGEEKGGRQRERGRGSIFQHYQATIYVQVSRNGTLTVSTSMEIP